MAGRNKRVAARRGLKYMRAFAGAWPERAIVQEALARIPWYHHIALMEKCRTPEERAALLHRRRAQGRALRPGLRGPIEPLPLRRR